MQVFTTIFLAETLRANVECVEETEGLDQDLPGAIEFKRTLARFAAMLERRVLPAVDDPERNCSAVLVKSRRLLRPPKSFDLLSFFFAKICRQFHIILVESEADGKLGRLLSQSTSPPSGE